MTDQRSTTAANGSSNSWNTLKTGISSGIQEGYIERIVTKSIAIAAGAATGFGWQEIEHAPAKYLKREKYTALSDAIKSYIAPFLHKEEVTQANIAIYGRHIGIALMDLSKTGQPNPLFSKNSSFNPGSSRIKINNTANLFIPAELEASASELELEYDPTTVEFFKKLEIAALNGLLSGHQKTSEQVDQVSALMQEVGKEIQAERQVKASERDWEESARARLIALQAPSVPSHTLGETSRDHHGKGGPGNTGRGGKK